jgi:Dolichyl-phosphate-mannose-protein mannosyltransferase
MPPTSTHNRTELRTRRPPARPRPRRGTERVRSPTAPWGTPAPDPATLLPPRGARLGAWLRTHAVSLAVGAGLLALIAGVLGTGIERYPALSDDEGTYVAQAWALLKDGSLGHYTYWYDHPPLGWIQLAAVGWLLEPLVGGGAAVSDARALMLMPALASAGLLYVLARRLGLGRPFAVVAVLLFALSPLAISSLRAVYLDNFATPWVLAAFVLAASPERRLWAYAASGACFAVAVLTKETSLLILLGLVLMVRQSVDQRTRAFCMTAFGTMLALIGLGYPLYAALKGELLPGEGHVSLLEAVEFQLYGRASTGSALDPGSQSHELVTGWLGTDPWLLLTGVVLAPVALFVGRLRPVAVTLLVLVAVGLRPGYLPQPYVIALLPFCALVAAGVLSAAWQNVRLRRWLRPAVAAAGVLFVLAAAPDWRGGAGHAMTRDDTAPVLDAERWIERNVDHRARLLVDDTLYVDLVEAGFAPRFGVVWFFKLDFTTNLDPSVARNLPGGWRAFDYVVSTRVIRSSLDQNPSGLEQVRLALRESAPVATFGSGARRVEVRRITGEGTGSGRIPPAEEPRATTGRAP